MIIGVGQQKTGTSTLRECLKLLGYNVKDTSERVLIPILEKKWDKVFSMLDGFDACEDTPWYSIYKELDKQYPNSKFVLTIREHESWYKSVSRHIGDLVDPRHEWIYGRGKGLVKNHKQNTLKVYNTHNEEVQAYFKDRPNDLLVIDFTKGEKWDKLCAFLGKDVPNKSFPHANNTKNGQNHVELKTKKFKFWRKQFRNNLKIRYIDRKNLW